MVTTTSVRSRSAIGVGVFFTLVTCYVLMEDVLWHGAPLTTKHVMTLAVLAGTIYFGHRWWIEVTSYRLGTAMGCTALFLVGTATCVIMSAGRNAEVSITKAADANSVNTDRKRLERNMAEAKGAYQDALNGNDPSLKEAKARYQAALEAEASECGSGAGPRCIAKRAITAQTRKDVETAQAAQKTMIDLRRADLETAETKFRVAPAEKIANADIRAAAGLISKLPYVTADAATLEALLLLFFPFMQALFCEVGAIVGYSIGLGHVRTTQRAVGHLRLPSPSVTDAVTVAVTEPSVSPTVPMTANAAPFATAASMVSPVAPVSRQPKPKRIRPTDVQLMHAAIDAHGGVVHSQNQLADYWQVSKGEVAKRVDACGDFLSVRRVGRCHEIRINDAFEYV